MDLLTGVGPVDGMGRVDSFWKERRNDRVRTNNFIERNRGSHRVFAEFEVAIASFFDCRVVLAFPGEQLGL